MIVFMEYNNIMENILTFLFNNKDEKFLGIHKKLILRLNNKWMSCIYMTLIHLAVQPFNMNFAIAFIAHVIFFMIGFKLYTYCKFMQEPEK